MEDNVVPDPVIEKRFDHVEQDIEETKQRYIHYFDIFQ